MATILEAGIQSSASALRLILFHVYSNPEILERLRTELNSASIKPQDKVQVKALEQLPYLTAVLMEGLRLSPGLATRMARVAPDRDIFYNERRIPAGTPVGMTTVLLHTDESMYPDPMRFDPKRWIESEKEKRPCRVFAPFSKGTRNCAGMQYSLTHSLVLYD